jgi:hypothetical protein
MFETGNEGDAVQVRAVRCCGTERGHALCGCVFCRRLITAIGALPPRIGEPCHPA